MSKLINCYKLSKNTILARVKKYTLGSYSIEITAFMCNEKIACFIQSELDS